MELKTYFAQDAAGNIISSAIVHVFLQGTTTLATGLTRADGTPLENPFAADGAGRIQFRAPDGYYDVQVSAGPGIIQTLTIQCVDYSEAKSAAEQAQDALNSITGINTNFEKNSREQWHRALAEAGLTLVSGSFEEGATASSKTDAVWHVSGGQCYTWDGAFPKAVPANSTPLATGGIADGAWVGVGDVSLRGLIAVDFNSIEAMRNSVNLLPGMSYSLQQYYSTINGIGGGAFYLDPDDATSADNAGTVIVNAAGQRLKRHHGGVCRWSDFGIIPAVAASVTKSRIEAAWAWGLGNGITEYETVLTGEVTIPNSIVFNVPSTFTAGEINIRATGTHKFAFTPSLGVLTTLFDIQGTTVPVNIDLTFDNAGMGRYPDTATRFTALRHRQNNSKVKVIGKNNYGWGVFVSGNDVDVWADGYNCDGQKLTNDASGWDNYGDLLYITGQRVNVVHVKAITTQGGRGGVIYENNASGIISSGYIEGYDRGVHVESPSNNVTVVVIKNVTFKNCNTPVLTYHRNGSDLSGHMLVSLEDCISDFQQQVSQRANTGFTIGHLMVSGLKCTVKTRSCRYMKGADRIQVLNGGAWFSDGDWMAADAGGINLPYARTVVITGLEAADNTSLLNAGTSFNISDSLWGGSINITAGYFSRISHCILTKAAGQSNCGQITLGSSSARTEIRNVTFQTPIGWAIDNTHTKQKADCPIIERVVVENSDSTATTTLLKTAETQYNNRYHRGMPSYVTSAGSWVEYV